ncbi:MAG: hypothetical protein VCB59_07480, partial [Gammaproteobacteria bacterium]
MTVVWIVGFAGLLGVVGRIAEGDDGFYVGVILGTLLGLYIGLRSRLSALELRLRETDSTLAILVAASRTAEPNPSARPAFTQEEERVELADATDLDQVPNPLVVAQHAAAESKDSIPIAPETDNVQDGEDTTSPVDPWREDH